MNFILEPTALKCFNHTLDVLKADPRITVRLGSPDDIRGALLGPTSGMGLTPGYTHTYVHLWGYIYVVSMYIYGVTSMWYLCTSMRFTPGYAYLCTSMRSRGA